MSRRFDFYGNNARAFNSREPEILLAGPAGTGKSVVLLTKCLTLLGGYPGCRGLFCRGTRSSLTQTGLQLWEDEILGADHPILTRNPIKRRVRQSYEFPNGSEFVICGLDDPGKALSAQYDFIYIMEATEEGVELEAVEQLSTRKRHGRMRIGGRMWHQLMMDCNPTSPHHWLYKRHEAGRLKLYPSRHKDNPRFWDRTRQEWTEDGLAYVEGELKRATGARYARFYEGKWAVAEGLVYGYVPKPKDEGGHVLPAGWLPPPDWARVWAIDWGLRAPSVLQLWAVDGDGRMHLYREVFKTTTRPDELGRWGRDEIREGREPTPKAVVCDHDEESKKLFEKAFGLRLTMADKADRKKGVKAMQARFDVQADGRARIFFREDARAHPPDQTLIDASRPASTVAELAAYTYDPKFLNDEPIDENDHGCDAARYCVMYVNKHFGHGSAVATPAARPAVPSYLATDTGGAIPDYLR